MQKITSKSLNQVLREVTLEYLDTLDASCPPDATVIETELLQEIRDVFELENSVKPKGEKWKVPSTLPASVIAEVLLKFYHFIRLSPSKDDLAIFMDEGDDAGLYVTHQDVFNRLVRRFNYSITSRERAEVLDILAAHVPVRTPEQDPDTIAVNNGLFDYKLKTLMPFTPDKVYVSKSRVDYVPSPVNPVIHNPDDGTDWDVESWMNELSDDPEIVNLLWEVIGAIIRPHVRWNKSAWFYSERGNNGKGTLCELMRQITGEGTYASIPLSEFGKDFMLEPLTHTSCVIVDENDVGTFIDKAANIKAVITGDAIWINRKFKQPISWQFHGFMVQCLNEMPRIRDKSESFYRRQLFIPFDKCFTGRERRYIKSDYLHRPDVLQYVLHRVLHMDYYTLSEPASCKNVLYELQDANDPLRQFAEDVLPLCRWDLLPYQFLYDMYTAWNARNNPRGDVPSRNKFTRQLNAILGTKDPTWEVPAGPIYTGDKMSEPEPLIAEYGLDRWKHPLYRGTDLSKLCIPAVQPSYRGLRRR